MAALQRLGAKSVPVVALGNKFVFAQSLADVAGLLGIDHDDTPELSPEELVRRLDTVLATAERLIRQFPPEAAERDVKERKRSYRQLGYHVFRIVEAFLDATIVQGRTLELDDLNALAPESIRTFDDVAAYGGDVRQRVKAWWTAETDRACARMVPTYWGSHKLHHVLERTTWHPAQHVRQFAMLLADFGVAPDRPLGDAELAGLPVPEKVWDD